MRVDVFLIASDEDVRTFGEFIASRVPEARVLPVGANSDGPAVCVSLSDAAWDTASLRDHAAALDCLIERIHVAYPSLRGHVTDWIHVYGNGVTDAPCVLGGYIRIASERDSFAFSAVHGRDDAVRILAGIVEGKGSE